MSQWRRGRQRISQHDVVRQAVPDLDSDDGEARLSTVDSVWLVAPQDSWSRQNAALVEMSPGGPGLQFFFQHGNQIGVENPTFQNTGRRTAVGFTLAVELRVCTAGVHLCVRVVGLHKMTWLDILITSVMQRPATTAQWWAKSHRHSIHSRF